MKMIKKLFLLTVVCAIFAGSAQVCLAKGAGNSSILDNDFANNVTPGDIVGSMCWAGVWASVANWCISGIFDPKPRKIVDFAVFFYATYHYVAKAYQTNKRLAEKSSSQEK